MSIGATLQAARQQAGLSVDDVATVTRVRATLIRQIESDNFEPCGGAIYARGHIRNIAAAVGLDPAPVVAEFNQTQAAASITAPLVLDGSEIVQRTPSGPNWTAAMLVTAVLLAVVAFVSLLTGPDGTPQEQVAASTRPPAAAPLVPSAEQPAAEPTTGAPSVEPEPEPEPEPASTGAAEPTEPTAPAASSQPTPATTSAPPVVAFNGVRVQIKVTGARCWVHVTDASSGKKVLYQGVLERGAVRDFTATGKLVVTFGNAGAVVVTANGRDLGAPGGAGEVVTVPFVPGDPGAG